MRGSVLLREQTTQLSAVNEPSPANWYPDPDVPSRLRFWDGVSWTAHYAPMPAPPNTAPDALASLVGPEWGISPRAVTNVAVNAPYDGWRRVPPLGPPIGSPINAPTAGHPLRRSLRPGEVLTGLGAFALVAAGFAFIRSVWTDLGVGGQIGVLLAIVLVQAFASLFAVTRIRVLGESLAASAAVTLLVAASWGYERLGAPERFFPAMLYGFAALHALVLLAPPVNRARTWGLSASAFTLFAGLSLAAVPSAPYLWALGLGAGALLLARFTTPTHAERFAALHLVLAVGHVLLSDAASLYMVASLTAVTVLAASTLLRGSYPGDANAQMRPTTLRCVVWTVALSALGLIATYGALAADFGYKERFVFTAVGFVAVLLILCVPPLEVSGSRKVFAGWMGAATILQLGREAVLVPSARFVWDLLVAIGAGYLLLGCGLLLLAVSMWRRWVQSAFAGAMCAALGWVVLLETRLEDTFSAAPYPEILTVPTSLLLLTAALLTIRAQNLSTKAFLPGALTFLVPSTLQALRGDGADLRFTVLVAVCVLCLPPGFRFRLHALVVPPGAVLLLLFSYRALGLLGDSWITLALAALVLLVLGSLFEKMRDRVRLARTYLATLR